MQTTKRIWLISIQSMQLMEKTAHNTVHPTNPFMWSFYPSPFTGKERDEETGYGYFGARYMDYELTTMWLSVDPMADKYPGISPYAYCAWNPVRLVDPDGRTVWLPDGTEYKPKMSTEDATSQNIKVIEALNKICESDEGYLMMDFICNHDNSIEISYGANTNYYAEGPAEAFFDESNSTKGTGNGIYISITWNADNPESVQTLDGMKADATYNLLDEICHAYDFCSGYGTNAIFNEDCERAEIQAVYRSNVVRHQLGDTNYRSRYYQFGKRGSGPLTAKAGVFYRPSWYPKAETDNSSVIMDY